MSSDLPIDPYEALEPSLTALLLGELTEAQAELVRHAIESDPALATKFEQLRYTISLVREAEAPRAASTAAERSEVARLGEQRRQQLLQTFKTVRPQQFKPAAHRDSRWLVPAAAASALISTVVAFLILGSPRSVRRMAKLPSTPTDMEIRRKLARGDSIQNQNGHTLPPNDRNEYFGRASALTNSIELPASASAAGPDTAVKLEVEGLVLPKEADLAVVNADDLHTRSGVVAFDQQTLGKTEKRLARSSGNASWSYGPTGGGGGFGDDAAKQNLFFADQPELGAGFNKDAGRPTSAESDLLSLGRNEGVVNDTKGQSEFKAGIDVDKHTPDNFAYRERSYRKSANEPVLGSEPAALDGFGNSSQTFQAAQTALPQLLSDLQAQKPPAATPNSDAIAISKIAETKQKLSEAVPNTGGRPLQQVSEAKGLDANSLVSNARQEQEKQQIDKEDLGLAQPVVALQPQPEIQTTDQATSTFSLNVSDVSFRLAGASFEQGKFPAPGTIRTEEFLNAFDYRDPAPAAGQRVAFAWDRATYPFAQNRDLLRLSVKTAAVGREPSRPLNLVLLLDNSGSMERADRVEIIRQALRVVASQLRTNDILSVVTFARTARLFVDGVSADQAGRVAEELGELPPQGGTNLEEAMNLAYQTALRHYLANGLNRVVLLCQTALPISGDTDPERLPKTKSRSKSQTGHRLGLFRHRLGRL